MKKLIFAMFSSAVLFSGCNKFLSDLPSKTSTLPITSVEQLDALLGNTGIFYQEPNRNAVLCTEDWGLTPELYNQMVTNIFTMEVIQGTTWNVEWWMQDGGEDAWRDEYNKIFNANLVLSNLDKVSGDENLKNDLRAEAHLLRANAYYNLVNTYCLPYSEETKSSLGLPIKLSTSFEENLERVPLEKVYERIEEDIKEALKSTVALDQDGVHRAWRVSKPAVNAFAARYYLSRNDYSTAMSYAETALSLYSELVDYNTEMDYYEREYEYEVGGVKYTVKYPETWQATDAERMRWKEFYLARFAYFDHGWYVPSQNLIDLYDGENDLRFKYHFVKNYSITKDRANVPWYGYIFFGTYDLPSGPTTSEMILIKAECQARKGQWQDAMQTLETLRVKRIAASAYKPLQAASQEEAVRHIMDERRRERPFALTWFDYRRYNTNEVAYDDVNLEREFYPYTQTTIATDQAPVKYTLKKGDKAWARPIPDTEIESSLGVIKQNEY